MRATEYLALVPTSLVNHDDKTDEEIRDELAAYAIDDARQTFPTIERWEAILKAGDVRMSLEVQFLVRALPRSASDCKERA